MIKINNWLKTNKLMLNIHKTVLQLQADTMPSNFEALVATL